MHTVAAVGVCVCGGFFVWVWAWVWDSREWTGVGLESLDLFGCGSTVQMAAVDRCGSMHCHGCGPVCIGLGLELDDIVLV